MYYGPGGPCHRDIGPLQKLRTTVMLRSADSQLRGSALDGGLGTTKLTAGEKYIHA